MGEGREDAAGRFEASDVVVGGGQAIGGAGQRSRAGHGGVRVLIRYRIERRKDG